MQLAAGGETSYKRVDQTRQETAGTTRVAVPTASASTRGSSVSTSLTN